MRAGRRVRRRPKPRRAPPPPLGFGFREPVPLPNREGQEAGVVAALLLSRDPPRPRLDLRSTLPRAQRRRTFAVTAPRPNLGRFLCLGPDPVGHRKVSCWHCQSPEIRHFRRALSLGLERGGRVAFGPEPRRGPKNYRPSSASRATVPRPLQPRRPTSFHRDVPRRAHSRATVGLGPCARGSRTKMCHGLRRRFLSAKCHVPGVFRRTEDWPHVSENEISRAVRQGLITGEGGAWDLISGARRRPPGVPRPLRGGVSADRGGAGDRLHRHLERHRRRSSIRVALGRLAFDVLPLRGEGNARVRPPRKAGMIRCSYGEGRR